MYSKHQRFEGIKRNYTPETVEKLRGSLKIEYTLAKRGTLKLWNYLTRGGNSYINAMGALTGKKMLLLRFPRRFDFDGGSSFDCTWKPLSLSQIWWILQCGAQFAWGFGRMPLTCSISMPLQLFFGSLSTGPNRSSNFFFRFDFHGHVNPRKSNDVGIHRNEQMNFGPWREKAMKTNARCDSTTFHSISLQNYGCT